MKGRLQSAYRIRLCPRRGFVRLLLAEANRRHPCMIARAVTACARVGDSVHDVVWVAQERGWRGEIKVVYLPIGGRG
jgi:hypothetical protein